MIVNYKTATPSLKFLEEKFKKLCLDFDIKDYADMIDSRELAENGRVKSSYLIIELATICGHFADSNQREVIDEHDAYLIAFNGWNIANSFISKGLSDKELYKILVENIKNLQQHFKNEDVSVNRSDIIWLLYCCYRLKLSYYKGFNYHMEGFNTYHDGTEYRLQIMVTGEGV